jgi:hypothetical protein
MSLFTALRDAIFGQRNAPPPTTPNNGSGAGAVASAGAQSGGASGLSRASQEAGANLPPPQAATTAAGAAPPMGGIDIEANLNRLAAQRGERLNWRTSIVDLLKLVGMDSSLEARRALADELGFTGDRNDSAAMNLWLHRQVMQKLAENGGRVPEDLLH